MSDIDSDRLGEWLEASVPGFREPMTIEKFAFGQSNPTYRIDAASGPLVLRRKPFGDLLPSAHQVEREYALMAALNPRGYPVPRPVGLCEDTGVIGVGFFVMECVEGRVFKDGALPGLTPQERRRVYDAMIDCLAQLHAVDYEAAGLSAFGRPGNYFQRQTDRWTRQYRASQTETIPEMDALAGWLPGTVPEQGRTSIIHGDYRIDNIIYRPHDPEVAAVLDWELSTIGDPLADFANLTINWLMPVDGSAALGGLDLKALGIPDIAEATSRYCAATGRDGLPDLDWYFAFSLFRLAAIIQGVVKRALDGNASNEAAHEQAARVVPIARIGWERARMAGAR